MYPHVPLWDETTQMKSSAEEHLAVFIKGEQRHLRNIKKGLAWVALLNNDLWVHFSCIIHQSTWFDYKCQDRSARLINDSFLKVRDHQYHVWYFAINGISKRKGLAPTKNASSWIFMSGSKIIHLFISVRADTDLGLSGSLFWSWYLLSRFIFPQTFTLTEISSADYSTRGKQAQQQTHPKPL